MPEKTLTLLETYPNATVRKMKLVEPAKTEPYKPKTKKPNRKLKVSFEPIDLSKLKREVEK